METLCNHHVRRNPLNVLRHLLLLGKKMGKKRIFQQSRRLRCDRKVRGFTESSHRAPGKPKTQGQPSAGPQEADGELGWEEALGCVSHQDLALARGIAVAGGCRLPPRPTLLEPATCLKISPVSGALRKTRVKARDEKRYQSLLKQKGGRGFKYEALFRLEQVL